MSEKPLALITGAAGDIGAEVARRLSRGGYRLLLVDLEGPALRSLVDELDDALPVVVDLCDREALEAFLGNVREGYGDLAVAFVNAGVIAIGDVVDLEPDAIDLQLDVNLRSAMHLIRACAQNMSAHGSGHIIATVSVGGLLALKGSATYSATKFGLRGFLWGLREELRPKGVHVCGVYPSGVDTQMLRHEARNGGSALNFINTPQTVEAVGRAVVRTLRAPRLESYVPYGDGLFGRILAVVPWLLRWLYPTMQWLGERGRRRYLARIGD